MGGLSRRGQKFLWDIILNLSEPLPDTEDRTVVVRCIEELSPMDDVRLAAAAALIDIMSEVSTACGSPLPLLRILHLAP